jgi:hypothetical protein
MAKVTNSKKITLDIDVFHNPGRSIAYRVKGRCHGVKVAKNFPTPEEAEAFKEELITAAQQGKSAPKRRVARTLFEDDAELRIAEIAYQRLKAALPKLSLLAVVDPFRLPHTSTRRGHFGPGGNRQIRRTAAPAREPGGHGVPVGLQSVTILVEDRGRCLVHLN